MTFFRVLRERPAELEEVCALTPHARVEFELADMDGECDDLELARRFWVRVNQSFAKTAGRNTGWTITTARTQSVPGTILGRLGRFAPCAERLARVSFECCDAGDLVVRLATADTLIYLDPPYLASSRVNREGRTHMDYRVDMGDEKSHRDLAAALHDTPATVVLSGYHSPLYDELYGDWPRIDIPVSAHSSNASKNTRSARVETLWSNVELDRGRLFAG